MRSVIVDDECPSRLDITVIGTFWRINNEAWECPKCGHVLYLTHYNANFGVQQHLETHGFVCYGVDYGEDFWKRDK